MTLADLHPVPNGALFHGPGPVKLHHRELARSLGLCVRVYGPNVYLCQPIATIESPPADADEPVERSGWRYALDAWLRRT